MAGIPAAEIGIDSHGSEDLPKEVRWQVVCVKARVLEPPCQAGRDPHAVHDHAVRGSSERGELFYGDPALGRQRGDVAEPDLNKYQMQCADEASSLMLITLSIVVPQPRVQFSAFLEYNST